MEKTRVYLRVQPLTFSMAMIPGRCISVFTSSAAEARSMTRN